MALSSGNHAASAVESIGESGSIKSLQQRKPLLRVIAVLPNAVNDRLIAPDSRLTMTTSGTMAHENGLITGEDGRTRCFWPGNLPDYLAYHDHEWGRPVTDDIRLFEKICLEGFQSGLSWLTILRKRENFRAAFAGFDFHKVARFDEADVERLVADKPASSVTAARSSRPSTMRAAPLRWSRSSARLPPISGPTNPVRTSGPRRWTMQPCANPTTAVSTRISKDLKKRGWSFVGPTTVYAFMQAMGLVNDHLEGCCCRAGGRGAARRSGAPGVTPEDLKTLIHGVAESTPEIGPLEESLKWGEQSFTPARRNVGSSVRIAPRRTVTSR
jgi:DNA-3-methyladenine glycosylase I